MTKTTVKTDICHCRLFRAGQADDRHRSVQDGSSRRRPRFREARRVHRQGARRERACRRGQASPTAPRSWRPPFVGGYANFARGLLDMTLANVQHTLSTVEKSHGAVAQRGRADPGRFRARERLGQSRARAWCGRTARPPCRWREDRAGRVVEVLFLRQEGRLTVEYRVTSRKSPERIRAFFVLELHHIREPLRSLVSTLYVGYPALLRPRVATATARQPAGLGGKRHGTRTDSR